MAHVVGRGATLQAGLDATMTEAYGPEKTGGFSRGDVVVSEDTIDYPVVVEPDVFVAFSGDAFARDTDSVAEGGLVVVERDLVDPGEFPDERPDITVETIPAVEAAEDLGRKIVANIVMLGAVVDLVGVPPVEAVEAAVRDVVPEGTEDLNERAFERGTTITDREVIQ